MTRPSSHTVWDLPIRLFHWLLVAAVLVAGLTGFFGGPGAIRWHLGGGLLAVALVLARIVWGFTGSTHARFGSFLPRPADVVEHLCPDAPRHLGHNPLGALMAFALIGVMLVIGVTGLAVLGGMLKTGPLAFWTFDTGLTAREVHELAAWAVVGLVVLHLGGVVVESRRSRENLARAMVTGTKQARPGDHRTPDVPARGALALAAVLVVAAGLWGANRSLSAIAPVAMPAAFDATTHDECSACHMAYHPSLLPSASWGQLMATLDDHFGEDASLDPDTAARIKAWLVANAAETADTLPAHVFAKVAAEAPFTVSETPFWKRQHGDLPEALFQRPAIRSRSNCAACHADAETGLFSPFAIHIPKE